MSKFGREGDNLALLSGRFQLTVLAHRWGGEVADAISKARRYEVRRRSLPAVFVMWTVLQMALHRHLSMALVLKESLTLLRRQQRKRVDVPVDSVTSEAFYRARYRLGPVPLLLLFRAIAGGRPYRASFHGLRLHGIDGVKVNLPDTPDNEERFGRPGACRGSSAFPQMLCALLVDASTRHLSDVVLRDCRYSERKAAQRLIRRNLGERDLLLMDIGISSYEIFKVCEERKVSYVARIGAAWRPRLVQYLGPGDSLVLITDPATKDRLRPTTTLVRMIHYQVPGHPNVRLLTNLLDPVRHSARELALLYHKRWECESAADELKTHLSTVLHGSLRTVFRSKYPAGILQEAYATFALYNMLRSLMLEASQEADCEAVDIGFIDTLNTVRRLIRDHPGSSARMVHLTAIRDIARCWNRRPRRPRQYPRKVRQKMSNYHLKRTSDGQRQTDYPKTLALVAPWTSA